MCRVDDESDWYVESTNTAAVLTGAGRCEDCGRKIEPGETFTDYYGVAETDDDLPSRFVIQYGAQGLWVDESRPFVVIAEDDVYMWDALGFTVDEIPAPLTGSHHSQCGHCYEANRWLLAVCDQRTVLVTCEDLIEHTHEYDAEHLGAAFMILAGLARRCWLTRLGALVPRRIVESLTTRAVIYARATGLDGTIGSDQ